MTVSLAIEDGVATMTLRRPEQRNALDGAMWDALDRHLATLETDAGSTARAVVVSGEGPAFCVGGDIADFEGLDSEPARRAYVVRVFEIYRRYEELPVPTVAAVHGHALGGGCELALVSDVVVADATARFGLPEARLGLVPGIAVGRGLRRMTGSWLTYLAATGETIDAETARVAGIVNEVVSAGAHRDRAVALAGAIAAAAPRAVRAIKELARSAVPPGYAAGAALVPELMGTADHAEGLAAFSERRPPEFRDA